MFRYEIIWQKTNATNFFFVKKQPAKKHENIMVFYKKQPTYNPQMDEGKPYTDNRGGTEHFEGFRQITTERNSIENKGTRYPDTVRKFSNGNNGNVHPTQKPIPLLEYLIKTYTNEGDTVIDNTMGSGTCGVACVNLNRSFIGIEMDDKYFDIATKRINEAKQNIFFT